ncbi:MAG: hypothetical protein RL523_524 [Actinomycetota bacterium]|jgi:hypothetical protein
MKGLKQVRPGTWVIAGFVAFFALIGTLMTINYIASQPIKREVAIGLYNDDNPNRKVNQRIEIAVKLDLKDKSAEKYPIQLEGKASGDWQVVKKYTATSPDNTVVFRVTPTKVGEITYRAEVATPSGVLISNELVLNITN